MYILYIHTNYFRCNIIRFKSEQKILVKYIDAINEGGSLILAINESPSIILYFISITINYKNPLESILIPFSTNTNYKIFANLNHSHPHKLYSKYRI